MVAASPAPIMRRISRVSTSSARPAVTVSMAAIAGPLRVGRQEITVVVEDTGIGIPADALATITEPFVQASSGERQQQGSGLGLTIVKALVEMHSGTLTIDSEEGRGTTVIAHFPASRVTMPARKLTAT